MRYLAQVFTVNDIACRKGGIFHPNPIVHVPCRARSHVGSTENGFVRTCCQLECRSVQSALSEGVGEETVRQVELFPQSTVAGQGLRQLVVPRQGIVVGMVHTVTTEHETPRLQIADMGGGHVGLLVKQVLLRVDALCAQRFLIAEHERFVIHKSAVEETHAGYLFLFQNRGYNGVELLESVVERKTESGFLCAFVVVYLIPSDGRVMRQEPIQVCFELRYRAMPVERADVRQGRVTHRVVVWTNNEPTGGSL